MCHRATLVAVTLLACAVAAAALPTSNDKVTSNVARVSIKRSPVFLAQKHESGAPAPATRKPVRYCHFQTPCAWRIYTYSDYAEISLINDYCVCRPNQKCKFYERHMNIGALGAELFDLPSFMRMLQPTLI